jgi:hypothetical protein
MNAALADLMDFVCLLPDPFKPGLHLGYRHWIICFPNLLLGETPIPQSRMRTQDIAYPGAVQPGRGGLDQAVIDVHVPGDNITDIGDMATRSRGDAFGYRSIDGSDGDDLVDRDMPAPADIYFAAS